jgi:acetyltransferase-like isoleucine patch superfamily enzyme
MIDAMGDDSRSAFERFVHGRLRPIAKQIVHRAVNPPAALKPLYAAIFETHWTTREVSEWAERSLLATPVFLAKCARHGERIAIDRIPYMTAPCHIELGDDVRFSGQINIKPDSKRRPRLIIGNGVFIGHNTTFDVAASITIGNFVSIGSQTYIADTEGHSHYNPEKPIWEVPASDEDIAPVVLEDGVQVGKHCTIMKGVRVGARSVIGAGSVLRTSVPSDSVVMGNPARVVKRVVTEGAP